MKVAPDLASALAWIAAEPKRWTPFAGGTDLMVVYERGQLPPGSYLSLHRCAALRGIEVSETHVTINAMATYSDVRDHAVIYKEFPMLANAAWESGAIAIQNRGTIGGNIMNGSPAADSPPALLAYGAEVALASVRGTRTLPYTGFHTGYRTTLAAADELLTAVRLPRVTALSQRHHFYEKVGTRAFQAISKVCFAGAASVVDGKLVGVGVGLGSVGPTVVSPTHLVQLLEGHALTDIESLAAAAADAMRQDIKPIDDIRSTATYRLQVAANLAADFVRRLGEFATTLS